MTVQKTKHVPVLLKEVLHYLAPQRGETYLDATAGYGGHAQAILVASHNGATLIDRDEQAIQALRQIFSGRSLEIIHQDFLSATQDLVKQGRRYDMILADLGVSSPHLQIASRGFSFQNTGPLDMRMDQRQTLNAADIVNSASVEELTELLQRYGEEPKAGQLARHIVAARPIHDTRQLAELARKVWPGHSRVHPATRLFQALRIAVNDELNQLQQALPIWLELLKPGGRLVVISFHSLEDRLIKQFFAEHSGQTYDASLRLLTKRPITAQTQELVSNPRARSARLRAAVKINKEREVHANSGKKFFPSL